MQILKQLEEDLREISNTDLPLRKAEANNIAQILMFVKEDVANDNEVPEILYELQTRIQGLLADVTACGKHTKI